MGASPYRHHFDTSELLLMKGVDGSGAEARPDRKHFNGGSLLEALDARFPILPVPPDFPGAPFFFSYRLLLPHIKPADNVYVPAQSGAFRTSGACRAHTTSGSGKTQQRKLFFQPGHALAEGGTVRKESGVSMPIRRCFRNS